MLVSDFDFPLDEELIAQEPLADRSASRMMRLDRQIGKFQDLRFRDFPELLRPDDLLVVNNSRVFPARLFGRRSGEHAQPVSPRNPAAKDFLRGRVEVLLTRQLGPREWQALVRPGRKLGVGEKIVFGAPAAELEAEIISRGEYGERTLRFTPVEDFFAAVEKLGHVPLPPYIARADRSADRERYQTVYARPEARGSVAAPTAGLHFTPEILARIHERRIEMAEITLHVGLGTFQPIHAEKVEDHKMHREVFSISTQAAAQINRALEQGRRVVAVGTTTVRTLEYAASVTKTAEESEPAGTRGGASGSVAAGEQARIQAGTGEADIFIYPGFQFRVVGALLTNFHLPQSTLLMLVAAFAGRENVLRAYQHAVTEKYRFFSYGDCMLIE
ncbi:MAG TPA: tRNA preQ1(34) S-adenosylmethionine ribosyltransferase-isomerase QueA [Candidatus Angelobacter sp.]